ncbi:hypothetical protein OV203_06310 [Nannocystis sp. ILAH1]|uniref:hypothetical protein n=1 Tax=Nannocystis sp. ILAH1 TaxID=2996789 RepID=UPI00226DCD13|nr:hypothetical protein [Nannocystis sp. ILAH1]MCY0986724.1 hypothetical protein [Nannocystis sp. ILAH1]
MLHRLTYLLALSTAPLAGCGSNEHCIGDCEPQTTSSDTAGPVTSTEGGTSTTAGGGTTTAETTTDDTPTTSMPGSTSTAAEDLTTTGAEGLNTCRDGIMCMLSCMLQVPHPTPPEYDANECLFTNCLELLSPAEMLKLQELQECAESTCAATPDCAVDEELCQACILKTMGSTNPPPAGECEALAIACQ